MRRLESLPLFIKRLTIAGVGTLALSCTAEPNNASVHNTTEGNTRTETTYTYDKPGMRTVSWQRFVNEGKWNNGQTYKIYYEQWCEDTTLKTARKESNLSYEPKKYSTWEEKNAKECADKQITREDEDPKMNHIPPSGEPTVIKSWEPPISVPVSPPSAVATS